MAPDAPSVKPETLCPKCEQRPGTEIWVGEGGTLAYVHGFHAYWCKPCVVTEQLAYARKSAARIPELESELARITGASS